jgi:hypothetical protein
MGVCWDKGSVGLIKNKKSSGLKDIELSSLAYIWPAVVPLIHDGPHGQFISSQVRLGEKQPWNIGDLL